MDGICVSYLDLFIMDLICIALTIIVIGVIFTIIISIFEWAFFPGCFEKKKENTDNHTSLYIPLPRVILITHYRSIDLESFIQSHPSHLEGITKTPTQIYPKNDTPLPLPLPDRRGRHRQPPTPRHQRITPKRHRYRYPHSLVL